MKVEAYIHSLKDHKNNRHVLGEVEIIKQIGDNQYLAEYRGVRCTCNFQSLCRAVLCRRCVRNHGGPKCVR